MQAGGGGPAQCCFRGSCSHLLASKAIYGDGWNESILASSPLPGSMPPCLPASEDPGAQPCLPGLPETKPQSSLSLAPALGLWLSDQFCVGRWSLLEPRESTFRINPRAPGSACVIPFLERSGRGAYFLVLICKGIDLESPKT